MVAITVLPNSISDPRASLARALAMSGGGLGDDDYTKLLLSQMMKGNGVRGIGDSSPVQHATQGYAQLANALMQGLMIKRMQEGDRSTWKGLGDSLLGPQAGTVPSPGGPPPSPPIPPRPPVSPFDGPPGGITPGPGGPPIPLPGMGPGALPVPPPPPAPEMPPMATPQVPPMGGAPDALPPMDGLPDMQLDPRLPVPAPGGVPLSAFAPTASLSPEVPPMAAPVMPQLAPQVPGTEPGGSGPRFPEMFSPDAVMQAPAPAQRMGASGPRGPVMDMVRAAAERYGIDPDFAMRLAKQESGFNQNAISSAGALGVMQLMPGTAQELGVDPRNLEQNIDGGMRYLAQQMKDFGGDQRLALAAYNAGPGRARSHMETGRALPAETRNYIKAIMGGDPVQTASLDPNAGFSPTRPAPVNGQQVAQQGPFKYGPATPGPYSGTVPPPAQQPQAPAPQGRGAPQIPPQVADQIRMLWMNPRTRQLGTQLYLQYAKPTDRYEPVMGPDGKPVAQRNTLTGKVEADPRAQTTDDIREYERAKQEGYAGTLQQFIMDNKRAGANSVTIDQRSESEFEKEYGKGQAKRATTMLEAADRASQNIQRIHGTIALLDQIQTGRLSPAAASVGAWAQSMGIDPTKLGIDPKLPMASEAAQALINQTVVGMIGSGGFPANNFSNADRDFLLKGVPSLANRPEANKILLEVARRSEQRNIDKAMAWEDAREQGQSFEKFEREWRKKINSENLFADMQEQIGAIMPQQGRPQPQQQGGQSGAPAMPKPGDVMQGYRFKGGNPADKNSWERVQ